MRTPTAELLSPDIRQLVADQKWREIRETLNHLEHADIADVIDAIEPAEDAALAFRMLPRAAAAEVFAHLEPERQETLLELLGGDRAARLIESLDPDDRAAVLDELPVEVARPLMQRMSPENRRVTQAILGYPEDSVGRLMTPDYVRVKEAWTIGEALAHVRRWGHDAETINWIYVVSADGTLVDDIHIRHIILADPVATVSDLMDHDFVALHATDDREEAVRAFARYDRTALPVIDSLGLLVGIVTFDDVADVAEEEFTEDAHKMGGLEALGTPYMATKLASMLKKRGGWLAGLFVMQIATIFVMSHFGEQLDKAVILAVFVPLIISSGGNTGTQAASLLVRAIALGEVKFSDWARVAGKELLVGIVLGSILGVLGTGVVVTLAKIGLVETEHALRVGLAIGTAVVGIVTWGALIGSLLPLLLDKLGLDPAASSSPLVATLMDVSGLTIYFAVAVLMLTGTVL